MHKVPRTLISATIIAGASLALSGIRPALASTSASNSTSAPKARKVETHASIEVGGKTIHYTATAGTIILRNKKNQPIGSMFYVAYTKDGVRDLAQRPVTFLYNGGPGASSNWLTMSGLGPYRVALANGAPNPPPPYDVVPSHETILNDTDLVFIDAMGTGFSHIVGKGKGKMFWGVDEDIKTFGQFIQRYLTQNDRWNSPLYLYGESYGTTRSAGLAYYLQQQGVAVNGVTLQSSVLNYFDSAPGSDVGYISYFPTFAALAWYHDKVPNKPASLKAFVEQARQFADGPYATALQVGNTLPKARLDALAEKMHEFTGLPVDYLERANLRVTASQFRKELMLPEREHIGRYDGRYVAQDDSAVSSWPTFDPSDQQISPALNQGYLWYVHHVLKWKTTRAYAGFNFDAYKNWDWKHSSPTGRTEQLPDVAQDLAQAMRMNPYLRVLSENGYYDMATPFHGTEYDLSQVNLSAKLRKHITFAYFKSGHPIYINPKSMKAMHATLDAFYTNTQKADARPMKGG
ncbi:MAG: peptidase S10 [Gammaproteobacteria bacterium]